MVRSGSSGTFIVFLLSIDHAEHQQRMIRRFGCSGVLTPTIYIKVKGKGFIQVSSIEMIGSPLCTNGHQLFVIDRLFEACLSCTHRLKSDPVRTLVKLEA